MAGPVDSHRDAADDKDVSYRGRSTAVRLPTISAGAVMGIYDREYYRGETRGSGWLSGAAPVCKTIILINVLVFVLQQFLPREFVEDYLAASADGILHHGRVWQLLTATFLHEPYTPFHLLWNMVFLWIVGREMEAFYGPRDFAALYLGAAIVSTLGWVICDTFAPHPGVMLGASGAVMAVVVVYALYYPHREVLLFFLIPVEMWLLVVVYLASDLWMFLRPGMGTKVAVASHLTGALFGFCYKYFDLRWSRLKWSRVRRPRLRVISPEPREKGVPRSSSPSWSPNAATASKPSISTVVVPEEQLDARLDEVLAKIAREGRQGLTEEENRVLQEASLRARNRRSDRL
jgi:membrane associated rhomboid family serine protease